MEAVHPCTKWLLRRRPIERNWAIYWTSMCNACRRSVWAQGNNSMLTLGKHASLARRRTPSPLSADKRTIRDRCCVLASRERVGLPSQVSMTARRLLRILAAHGPINDACIIRRVPCSLYRASELPINNEKSAIFSWAHPGRPIDVVDGSYFYP